MQKLVSTITVLDQTLWEFAERPGYVGKRRKEMQLRWNSKYGHDNWQLAWQWGHQYLPLFVALNIYEDAYYHFLAANPDIIEQLVRDAGDIYDDAPSNVCSGLDYLHQETDLNHWHDIAIRRALLRNGSWFAGTELVHIRHQQSEHPLSMLLSPGQVPFHRPDLIAQPQLQRWWWEPDSVESFYQSNKVLLSRAA